MTDRRRTLIGTATARVESAARHAARVRAFSELLRERRQQRGPLLQAANTTTSAAVLEVVEEYREELSVAEEELHAQVEELEHALGTIDAERRRYRALFDATPVAVVVTDGFGAIRAVNERAAAVFAAAPEALTGKPIVTLVAEGDVRSMRQLVSAPVPTTTHAITFKTRAGEAFSALVTCAPLGLDHQLAWTIERAPSSDRSDAQLVRALRDKEELLGRERAARMQLEREIEARDRFLAVLSHDLRGPIHAVLGWAQILRREVLGKEARDKALATIERNSRAQLALVEELLDLARIAAGKLQLEVAPVDLPLLVQRVVEGARPAAAEAEVDLACHLAEDCKGIVFGDAARLEQIARNLVGNAIKFTAPGGKVQVDVHQRGAHLVFRVADNGRGIEPKLLPRVFDAFRQGEAGAGIGLGLSIVRQLVELHGGTVEATSDGTGKGAQLTVHLPAGTGTATKDDRSSTHLLPAVPDLRGTRVLLVEDDHDSRELLREILTHQGASLALAATAAEAVALFKPFRPDVLVSDVGLPDEDGCALLRKIRQLDPRIPAVAFTGFASGTDVARTLEAGFDVHMSKPIEPSKLVAAIHDLVAAYDASV